MCSQLNRHTPFVEGVGTAAGWVSAVLTSGIWWQLGKSNSGAMLAVPAMLARQMHSSSAAYKSAGAHISESGRSTAAWRTTPANQTAAWTSHNVTRLLPGLSSRVVGWLGWGLAGARPLLAGPACWTTRSRS